MKERTVIHPEEEILSELGQLWSIMLVHIIRKHFPNRTPESVEVLNVDTGAGFIAGLLGKYGYQVTGIDGKEEMLTLASEKTRKYRRRITLWKMKADDMFFPDESFDVIISRDWMDEHRDWEAILKEWHRVLRPGGMILSFDAVHSKGIQIIEKGGFGLFRIAVDPHIGRFLYYRTQQEPVFPYPLFLTCGVKE